MVILDNSDHADIGDLEFNGRTEMKFRLKRGLKEGGPMFVTGLVNERLS